MQWLGCGMREFPEFKFRMNEGRGRGRKGKVKEGEREKLGKIRS